MNFLKNKNFILILVVSILLVLGLTLAFISYIPSLSSVEVELHDNIRQQDFSIEDSEVLLRYRDGSVKNLQITKDMLSDEDLAKLSTPGKHVITINYTKRKSVKAQVHLLRNADKDSALDMMVQGMQKAAPQNNINGEIAFSAYYEIQGQPRKDYTLSLKFTLDIDEGDGAENYLGLEITEDKNVLLGIYYKDNKESRPDLYLKSDGPFVGLMNQTQNKFKSVSADEYFGQAIEPDQDSLWTFDGIFETIMSLVGDSNTEAFVDGILNMLFTDAGVADDGTATVINIDFNKVLDWLPLAALIPGVSYNANNFLDSMNIGANFSEVVSAISVSPLLRIKAMFDNNGALKSLDLVDKVDNNHVGNALSLNLDGRLKAGLNINKISVKADNTSFSLPRNKGIENWTESDVSFERWVLLQYRRMLGEAKRPASREGMEEYFDIDYIGDDSPYHKLDVYRPQSQAGNKLPVIINIHGGGWVHGNKEATFKYSQYLASQDFVVVNINYHLLPTKVMPEPMQDIFAVFNFVMNRQNADTYGFDTDNVYLTGDSAGGHYVLLALSVLVDPKLSNIYGVQSDIKFNAAGVSSTGFTFTEVLKLPIPFAHFYVNQFFSDDLPYTAYRDDPRYIDMARSLNIENNKIERFPPMFVSSAHGDTFSSHSDRLAKELEDRGVEYIYDFRESGDKDNPENYFLGHDFNINAIDWPITQAVNNRMCDFFKSHIEE